MQQQWVIGIFDWLQLLLNSVAILLRNPSNSIWRHLSYGLVRSKRGYCH